MGADYKNAHDAIMSFAHEVNQAANQTRYIGIGYSTITDPGVRIPIPKTGVIRHLFVESEIPPGAGESYIFTVMINTIATAITCTIAGAVAFAANDVVNAAGVVAGDTISLRCVSSLNAAAAQMKASCLHTG